MHVRARTFAVAAVLVVATAGCGRAATATTTPSPSTSSPASTSTATSSTSTVVPGSTPATTASSGATPGGTATPLAAALGTALRSGAVQVHAPAATGAVVRCGQVVWQGVTGVTDVTTRQPLSGSTRFVLASTTKTVTSTMVMSLVQSGRLSLGTPVSKYYPTLPDASTMTVRELLDMTSGLPEYFDDNTIANIIDNEPRHRWSRSEVIAALSTMRAAFPPGSRYSYTDSNYVVLGGIVEQVSGTDIQTYFERAIAAPAGMTSSTFAYAPSRSDLFAHPYVEASNGSLSDQFVAGYGIAADYWGPVWTDGGLASTAVDLARFGSALFSGKLVSPATLATMTVMGPNDYGLGIFDQIAGGHRWLGHNGAYGGFESEDWTDPARSLTITVTTDVMEPDNANYAASDVIWQDLVRAYDAKAPSPTVGC